MRLRAGLFVGVAVGAAALAAWGVLRQRRASGESGGFEIEPRALVLADDANEGDVVKVHLMMTNPTSRPIEVRNVAASCGCMGLVTAGGKPPTLPLTLPPNSAIPLQVAINTEGRMGKLVSVVYADVADGATTRQVDAEVTMNVRAAWRLDPTQITVKPAVPGTTYTRTIDLYDAFPDPGIDISDIVVSDRAIVSTRVVPCEATEERFGGDTSLRRRHRVEVAIVADARREPYEASIILHPRGDHLQRIRVPIAIIPAPPRLSVSPRGLTLADARPGQVITRRLTCTVAGDGGDDLRIVRQPDYAKLTLLSRSGGTFSYELTITVPAGGLPDGDAIGFASGTGPDATAAYAIASL